MLLQKEKQKDCYDKKTNKINMTIGERVKVIHENRTKFEPKYTGPYEVLEIKHPNVVLKLLKNQKVITVHLDRVARL